MRSFWIATAALAAFLLAPAPDVRATVGVATFDFETPPLVNPDGSLQWTDVDTGLTIVVSREGAPLEVADLNLLGVPDYGVGCLSPFGDPFNPEAISVTFIPAEPGVEGVRSVQWDMGDFVGSDDDEVRVTTVALTAPEPVNTPEAEIIPDPGVGVFASTTRSVQRTHPIDQWSIRAGSTMFPMSMYVDRLVVQVDVLDFEGKFTGGQDIPESVPGGGGGNNNVSGDGGAGGTPIGALAFQVESAGIGGAANGLLASLNNAQRNLEKGDPAGAVKHLGVFLRQLAGMSHRVVDPDVAADLADHAEAIIDLLS